MVETKKINNIKIKPIQFIRLDLPIKGQDMFPDIHGLYGNIFLVAKKRSGKSTVIYNIIKKCVGRDTKVYIFCSTVNKDQTYKKIMDFLDHRNIYYEAFASINENGENNLQSIIDEMKQDDEVSDEEEKKPPPKKFIEFEETKEEKAEKKKRKLKYIAPEYMFIFDDLGQLLRDKTIEQLLKTNRHFKCKVILSSQYLNDLNPASRLNLDFVLVFKGMPLVKLEQIHKDIDISTDFNKFKEMYDKATEHKFNFLYIDTRTENFRINFNESFVDIE